MDEMRCRRCSTVMKIAGWYYTKQQVVYNDHHAMQGLSLWCPECGALWEVLEDSFYNARQKGVIVYLKEAVLCLDCDWIYRWSEVVCPKCGSHLVYPINSKFNQEGGKSERSVKAA